MANNNGNNSPKNDFSEELNKHFGEQPNLPNNVAEKVDELEKLMLKYGAGLPEICRLKENIISTFNVSIECQSGHLQLKSEIESSKDISSLLSDNILNFKVSERDLDRKPTNFLRMAA